jgi:Ca2+-binding EF-hand superfamily protein
LFFSRVAQENNPLVRRVVEIFDADASGAVDFKEFIGALSVFADPEHAREKLLFAFKIYDSNNDGFISNGDLYNMLKTMVGDNLEDAQLQQLVDRTIMQGDANYDGRLTFEEFAEVCSARTADCWQSIMLHLRQSHSHHFEPSSLLLIYHRSSCLGLTLRASFV